MDIADELLFDAHTRSQAVLQFCGQGKILRDDRAFAMTSATIAVCTYNRVEMLAGCLRSLGAINDPDDNVEILVVDNGSTDGTSQLLDRWIDEGLRRRTIVEPRLGLSHARNMALESSDSDVVLYIDDDAVAPPTWATFHLRHYEMNPRVVAVGGPIELRFPDGRPNWLVPSLEHWWSALELDASGPFPPGRWPYGANMSFRRAEALEAGAFSPRLGPRGRGLRYGEEPDLMDRLYARGGLAMYERAAPVLHLITASRCSRSWVVQRAWCQGRANVIRANLAAPMSRAHCRHGAWSEARLALSAAFNAASIALESGTAEGFSSLAHAIGRGGTAYEFATGALAWSGPNQ